MSAPHRTAITYVPEPQLRRTRALVCEWTRERRDSRAAAILGSLDGAAWKGSAAAAATELRQRIESHARSLPWPGALLITADCSVTDARCEDLLTVCTVLAKSSGALYLRDKEPNLERLRRNERAVLQFPIDWSSR